MAIIRDAQIWHPKLHPSRPNMRFAKQDPKGGTPPTWEVQIRTNNPETQKEWAKIGVRTKMELGEDNKPYWFANLKRKTIKADGTPADPPKVVAADLSPVDPDTIGNGSIGNVQIFQYKSKHESFKGKTVNVLTGVQIINKIEYVSDREDFEAVSVVPVGAPVQPEEDGDF